MKMIVGLIAIALYTIGFLAGYRDHASYLQCVTGIIIMLIAVSWSFWVPSLTLKIWTVINILITCYIVSGMYKGHFNHSRYSGYAAIIFFPMAALVDISMIAQVIFLWAKKFFNNL